MSLKEQYWKYSLIALILGVGTVIFIKIIPFLGGLLGAATLYVLLRGQMQWLCDKHRWRRGWAAALLLLEAILCFLIPLSGVIWMIMVKVQDLLVDPHAMIASAERFTHIIEEKTGYDLTLHDHLATLLSLLPKIAQFLMTGITSFAINVLVLLFVLYFMLVGGPQMERYITSILPFNPQNTRHILHEIKLIVKSNALGIPLLAVIQGSIALIGYFIFHVPNPLFFGILTSFATIIPIIGTAIIWTPLCIYLAITGAWSSAIGLFIYAAVGITHVDNLVRFMMQRKMANTHPLITIFGVIIGLSLFGFMGIIFGPLMLELFILCANIFKVQYLDQKP